MASEVEKRLKEIEAVYHEDAHLVEWLCARLRDALRERDAAVDLLISMHERMKRPPQERLDEAWEIVRRLFGEEESRG